MSNDNEVDIKFVSDDRDIIKSFLGQQKEILKNQRALINMGNSGQKSFKKIQQGSNESTKSLMKFNTSMIGAGSVVAGILAVGRQINEEHKDFMRRNRESQVTSRSFGEQMRLTRIAFTEDDTLKNKELEDVTKQVAKNTQTDANIIGAAFTDAFSAKGALTNQDAVNATEAAFSLLPNDLESGSTLASRAMDISNATGEKDMKAIVGFLQNIQNTARITTLAKVGQNLVPAINALQQSGDTPEQAAEVVVTLTKLMSDAKGELSKTASINLATRLGDFVPDKKGQGKDERGKFKIPKEQLQEYEAAGSTTERIAVMQKSPELRREFIAKNPFAAESSEFVKALLKGEQSAQAQYRATQEGIKPLDANQVGAFNQKLSDIQGGEFQSQVNAKERGDANLQEFQLNDKLGQDIAAAEEVMNKALGQVGLTERTMKQADFSWLQKGVPAEYASGIIEDTIIGLKRDRGGSNGQPINLDVDNRIKFLESQKKVLDDLAAAQRVSREKTAATVAPDSEVKEVRKLLNFALEGRKERFREAAAFERTRDPINPASTAISQLQPELQAYQELQARGKISEAQLGVLNRLASSIEKLQELSNRNTGSGAGQQNQDRLIKALENNAKATEENNRLKTQEKQSPSSGPISPARRPPYRSPSSVLSRSEG
ncbi:MAG: hypothetical protein KDA77_00075 [Planctomycetaceae bacterium]|nr:hypothetical protein [Planctomycetaceae bacterium]